MKIPGSRSSWAAGALAALSALSLFLAAASEPPPAPAPILVFAQSGEAHGMGGGTHGSAPGIVLQYGAHRGRPLWPARAVDRNGGYDDSHIPDRQPR